MRGAARNRARRGVRLIAAGAALALVLGACGNSGDDDTDAAPSEGTTGGGGGDLDENVPIDEVGVTDSEIRVTVVASVTNPLGGRYKEFADGVQAYFDMVNADGGIYGRELTIAKVRDDQLANNQAEIQAAIAEDDAFAVFVAALLFTGANDLATERVPTFGWNINPEWIGPDNFFPNSGALCFGCPGKILPWLAKEVGKTKIGIVGYGTSAQSKLCAEGNRRSFELYADETGAEVVFYDDTVSFGVTDLSAQVAQMKQAGVDFVTTCMDQNAVLTLAQEMDKQGLDVVQHMPQGYDASYVSENAEVLEGNYIVPQFTAFEHEPQPETMQQFLEWIDKTGAEPVELAMQGWIAARQFHEGLKLAGPQFDREKVIAALNGVTDFTADGMIVPIDWTRQHEDPAENPDARGALSCANFVQVSGGEMVSVFAEDGKPWVCFDARSEAWEEPTFYSFVDYSAGGGSGEGE